jgi:hypothetical protein
MIVEIVGGTTDERRSFVSQMVNIAAYDVDAKWELVTPLLASDVDKFDGADALKVVETGAYCNAIKLFGRSHANRLVVACDDSIPAESDEVDVACQTAMMNTVHDVDVMLSIDKAQDDAIVSVRDSPRTAVDIVKRLWR